MLQSHFAALCIMLSQAPSHFTPRVWKSCLPPYNSNRLTSYQRILQARKLEQTINMNIVPWKQREWCCICYPYGLPEFVLCFGYLNLLGTPGIWQHVYYHLKKKKKKRIFKKFYFYLWLSLRKGNGFYKQMLEIIIVLLQLYSTCAPPLRNLCIRQSSRIKVVAAFQQRKRPPGK